jgi:hypothetical protein
MIFLKMKSVYSKIKKPLLIIVVSLFLIGLLVILFISPITKHMIEKYDEKYTGRQIKTGWVYVNPFTGFIYINNLKIYESKDLPALQDKDSIFFSAKGLSINFAMFKMLFKTFEITNLTLYQPKGIIIQSDSILNFNDLIRKFTSDKKDTTPSTFHFNILNIKIKNGVFYYREKVIPINYYIKDVTVESTGKKWNADTIAAKFSFLSGIGSGSVQGNFTINLNNLDYRAAAIVDKFDLKPLEQYLKDLINYGHFSASLDADIKATGNLNDEENLNSKGIMAINDFHFGKNQDEDYASFDKLVLSINELSPKQHQYLFDSMILIHPYLKYEIYDYLDNLQMMFGKKGSNISAAKSNPSRFNLILQIADYVKVLSKNFFQSDYMIRKLAVTNGCLKFNDYSTTEKFSIEANPLSVFADSVDKTSKRVAVYLKSDVQPYGNILINLSINPSDSGDFDMQYHLQNLPVSMFNPYMITYTSFPFDRGTLELNGNWHVRNSSLKSNNHLLVIDPRLASRLRNKDTKWIPSPLMMYIVRERGNVVDYELPITGNLKDPKFHLGDVIFDALGNIFIKPATIPYRAKVKNIENVIEKSLSLKWEMRQSALLPDQEKFVKEMVNFLIQNPEASIAVYPLQYKEKEKEQILFFEAKKKYFLSINQRNVQSLDEDDSLKVDKMSVKDSLFTQYLNKKVSDTMLFTVQDKCYRLIGSAIVNSKFEVLSKDREAAFMSYFMKKGVESRVKINNAENIIPYNGFSFYKIVYNGEFPESIIKAYQQMDEFNKVTPRKRFEKEREVNRNAFK